MARRITARFNDVQESELETLKLSFHLEGDGEAIHLAVEWVNHYIKNVSQTFFPPNFDVILSRKLKTIKRDRKVY